MKTRRLRALKLEIKILIKSEMHKYNRTAVAVDVINEVHIPLSVGKCFSIPFPFIRVNGLIVLS